MRFPGVPRAFACDDATTRLAQYLTRLFATPACQSVLVTPLLVTTDGREIPAVLAMSAGVPRVEMAPAGPVDDAVEAIDPDVVQHVKAVQNGNAYSFSILYDRYVDKVFAYCYHRVGDSQTAEDLTSDVFIRALKRIDTFTWQGKDFGAWLTTIARNRCHDHFKSARFRLESCVAEVHDSMDTAPSDDAPEQRLEQQELRADIHSAMARLKSEQSEVLYHRFMMGYDVETTAHIMGKKAGAIRALQYRALKALSKHVDVEALL
ncbi:MAG: sigma-70 family RNA polymerase sigma factor [Euzebya sp.]